MQMRAWHTLRDHDGVENLHDHGQCRARFASTPPPACHPPTRPRSRLCRPPALMADMNRDGVPDFVVYSGGTWAVKSGVSPYGYIAQGVKLGGASDIPL